MHCCRSILSPPIFRDFSVHYIFVNYISVNYIFVILVFFVVLAMHASYFQEKKIHAAVLDGYNLTVRPSVSNGTLGVSFQLKIQNIIKLVRKNSFSIILS